MATQQFKPNRKELNRVQYLANECMIEMHVGQRIGAWYGTHRPAQRSAEAFALSARVAQRASAVSA